MQDGHSVCVRYTEPMLRRAVRAYVRRRLLRRWPLWLVAAGLLLASVGMGLNGGAGFGTGVAAAALVFLLLFVALVWWVHFRNTVGRFRSMDPPTARLLFGEHELTATSNLGSSTIPWTRFVELWELEDAWMLFMGPAQFMTLPTAGLPDAVKDHVRARIAPKQRREG